MKINIPCPNCGCLVCEAKTIKGGNVTIEICRCNDGSGEFNVYIVNKNTKKKFEEKHQCSEAEIAGCLSTRFQIDVNTITHQCFN